MTEAKKHNAIKAWMVVATVGEQNTLAHFAYTSRAMLYQYASGNRKASSEKAAFIEAASMRMAKISRGRLPVIYRTDLSAACANCPFARKCLGIKTEFELV